MDEEPPIQAGTGMPNRERSRICEVPLRADYIFIMVSLMPLPPLKLFLRSELLRGNDGTGEPEGRLTRSIKLNRIR
jgi:hypothetical protein